MSEYALSQALQMLERLIVISTVVELDRPNARAKVDWGNGAKSDWLPIAQLGSESLKFWIPPEPGTQVIVLSPGGDTTRGIILPGPFSGAPPAGNFEGDVSGKGNLTLDQGDAQLKTGSVVVDQGDVSGAGVSLKRHVHSGVSQGPDDTGSPK
ncbi:phage baseplate assembly protein V [Ruegeria marisrubri]|uniref:phage baseplate assembly protein V n=1 Tax=Ruegeria marisrubri TaxID=1685379 RepID=UPI001CD78732|nr:phage baseplate assembly protein V [Ruegeria marisrubri]MCA0905137.1 phage baseplate assembly protein V [Ruegeria marisrubri]